MLRKGIIEVNYMRVLGLSGRPIGNQFHEALKLPESLLAFGLSSHIADLPESILQGSLIRRLR